MHKYLYILLFIFSTSSCNNSKPSKLKIGNQIIESHFTKDSLFEGETRFYSESGNIQSKMFFTNGMPNGVCINYYSNGKVKDSSLYKVGYQEGYHYVYDSLGKIVYCDFYLHDHLIGDRKYYENGLISNYSFFDYEGRLLYGCDYDSIGVKLFWGDILNVGVNSIHYNDTLKSRIFIYFIKPEKIEIDYTLGFIDSSGNKSELTKLEILNRISIDTIVNNPPKGLTYYVSLKYNDTINNFQKIYLSDLK